MHFLFTVFLLTRFSYLQGDVLDTRIKLYLNMSHSLHNIKNI